MKKIKLKIKGMHCKSCEMLIKDALEETGGIKKADVSQKNNSANIEFDETKIDAEKIKAMIKKEGYGVE
ncbi:MAG: heavy-metal-associated domain-containing protein [Nanoarchaeota archaeon]|nr:heavy-metal-associated domain-containing protein [Nanoarchaeota archaeon]